MEKIKNEQNIEETKSVKSQDEKVDFAAMFAAMKKQMDEQAETIKKQNEAIAELTKKSLESNNDNNNSNNTGINAEILSILQNLQNGTSASRKMVKVICLDDVAQAMFKLQNGKMLRFSKSSAEDTTYGKIVPISEEDALLLLSEYEGAFVRGALKFDEEHQYLLREKGIEVDKINYHPMEDIKNFEILDNEGITELYKNLKAFQKDMLKAHIVNLIRQDKVNETLVDKIKHLNRLSKKEGDVLDNKGAYDLILERLKEGGLE